LHIPDLTKEFDILVGVVAGWLASRSLKRADRSTKNLDDLRAAYENWIAAYFEACSAEAESLGLQLEYIENQRAKKHLDKLEELRAASKDRMAKGMEAAHRVQVGLVRVLLLESEQPMRERALDLTNAFNISTAPASQTRVERLQHLRQLGGEMALFVDRLRPRLAR
jgi:hypothetical protein